VKVKLDVHCHTVSSGHAYSTVTENAAFAAQLGLGYIGVADHGPDMPGGAHLTHFSNLWTLPEVIHGVRVFKGAEVNIINTEGELDLPDDILAKMEFVIASLHRGVTPPSNKENHTAAIINAMENPHVHILGHPGDAWFDIDIEAVIKQAANTRTIIEINNMSLNPGSIRYNGDEVLTEILKLCREYNVPILASSDAHYCTMIGDVDQAMALINKFGIQEEQVLNTSVERFLGAVSVKSSVK